MNINEGVPVYVTRKNADGLIAAFWVNRHSARAILILAQLNVVGWGIYGLVELVSKVIG